MKVLITTGSFGQYDKTPLERLKKVGAEVIANPYGQRLSVEQCYALYSMNIEGVIAGTEQITIEVLKRAKSLKVISRCGVGLDNVDVEAAQKNKIRVYKTSLAVADAVAELSLGLIFNSLRFISYTDRMLRQGKWQKPMGFLLKEKTLGIIGLGSVGKKIIQLCEPFQCQFLAFDVLEDNSFAEKYKVRYTTVEELLQKSDVVSIHLPLNDQTKNFITEEKLRFMKKNAFLVNTSRGNIVEEEGLYRVLKEGAIAGAALDVFAQEPYSGKLRELENIILTSHIGSYARESRVAMELEAVDNLMKGLNLI